MSFTDIENLARLLSAENPRVREMVRAELHQRRDRLEAYLARASDLPADDLYQLHEIVRAYKAEQLRADWLSWTALGSTYLQLEQALDFLARRHDDNGLFAPLPQMLDALSAEFLKSAEETSVEALKDFLFTSGRLTGAKDDYFNPLHSNLCYVLREGRGLPISLCAVMMLVGYRLGLDIRGFNLPGHFLARATVDGCMVLIDCFNSGKFLTEGEIAALSLSPKINFQELVAAPPSAADIVTRVLVNLINAYHRVGNLTRHFATQDLLADLRRHMAGKTQLVREVQPGEGEEGARFRPGQLVRHRNYGYRGVVVDFDPTCRADDKWYQTNRTQPDKNQPWYHVLVDGSSVTTYAAQGNLEEDPTGTEIRHPLIPLYFQGFHDGGYRRNNVPWSL